MSGLFKCRVCGGSGLLQHPGGPEYATHCTECENEEMRQISDLDNMIWELRQDRPSLSVWMQAFHVQVAGVLTTLAWRAKQPAPLSDERIASIFYHMGTATTEQLQTALACARAIELAHGIE